jgi:hypothetical protein
VVPARRMVAAGGASTWAAPRQLLVAVRNIARRTVEASGVRRRAASQSLKLQAACSARFASSASSPTMRRRAHRNTVCIS